MLVFLLLICFFITLFCTQQESTQDNDLSQSETEQDCPYKPGDEYVLGYGPFLSQQPPSGFEWIEQEENPFICEQMGEPAICGIGTAASDYEENAYEMARANMFMEFAQLVSRHMNVQISRALNEISSGEEKAEEVITIITSVRTRAEMSGIMESSQMKAKTAIVEAVDAATCAVELNDKEIWNCYVLGYVHYGIYQQWRDLIIEDARAVAVDPNIQSLLGQLQEELHTIDQSIRENI